MAGRLIFTLFDIRGRPIAFAGRRLPPDESGAKYVNSPESPLWKKGSTLYGLHLARTAIATGGGGDRRRGLHGRDRSRAGGIRQRRGLDGNGTDAAPVARAPQARPQRRAALRRRHGRAARRPCAASSSPRAPNRLERCGSRCRRRARIPPRWRRAAARRSIACSARRRACSHSASSLVLGAADTATTHGREGPTRRSRASCAARPPTPERDELVRLAASRLRLPADAAARLAPARPARRRATERGAARAPAHGRGPARRVASAGACARIRRCRLGYAGADPARGVHARGAAKRARLGTRPTEPG